MFVNVLQGDVHVTGLACVHHAVGLDFTFVVIDGVRIEAFKHGLDGGLGELSGGNLIGVLVVQLVEHIDENIHVFDNLKIVLGL